MEFVPIAPQHYRRMAELHDQGMAGGLLPSLGRAFLRSLDSAMSGSGVVRDAAPSRRVMAFHCDTDDHAIGVNEQSGRELLGRFELYDKRWAPYRVDFDKRTIRG